MSVAQVVFFLVAVLYSLRETEACSCMPAHPQDQYCRSSFVIKASIMESQFIYERTERPVTEPTTTTTTTTAEPMTEPMTEPWREPTAIPEPQLPMSETPEEEVNVEDLILGNLAEVLPRQLERRLPLPLLGDAPVGLRHFPEPIRYVEEETPRRPIKLEYTVKVEKVFKGDDVLLERTLAKIYTQPEGSLCGLIGLEEGKSYVLSGRFYNNELLINLCNWVVPYKGLTKIQKRGIKMMYKKNCEQCTITSCYGRYCKHSKPAGNICMFDTSQFFDSCEMHHSVCASTKTSCKWQRNRDYKQCLFDRRGDGSNPGLP